MTPARERAAHRSAEERAETIRYYQEWDAERKLIARAGQQRTLRDHRYYKRMREFRDISQKYL